MYFPKTFSIIYFCIRTWSVMFLWYCKFLKQLLYVNCSWVGNWIFFDWRDFILLPLSRVVSSELEEINLDCFCQLFSFWPSGVWYLLTLKLLYLATWRKDIKPRDIEEAINSAVPGKLRVISVSEVMFCSGFPQNQANWKWNLWAVCWFLQYL